MCVELPGQKIMTRNANMLNGHYYPKLFIFKLKIGRNTAFRRRRNTLLAQHKIKSFYIARGKLLLLLLELQNMFTITYSFIFKFLNPSHPSQYF